jgi:phage baseplate assembly protein W
MKSIKVPFSFNHGRVSSTSDIPTISEQKITNVLVTTKTERVGIPDYGSGIIGLVHEINDPLVFSDFKFEAIMDLKQGVSSVGISDMQIRQGIYSEDGENVMMIDVAYRLPLGVTQLASLKVAYPGYVTEDTTF